MRPIPKKPYKKRTDLEKIQSQWTKLTGLHTREESSAAIVRAATAAEIAANFAIRKEFETRGGFDPEFVDGLLRWANGIGGKVNHLLLPLFDKDQKRKTVRALKTVAERINRERNAIVHQGEFSDPGDATAIIEQTKLFIETLVRIYEPSFKLTEKKR